MQCSFCGNPEHLVSYLFTADSKLGSSEPISPALICENCVRTLHRQVVALLAEKLKADRESLAGKNATTPEK